MLVFEQMGGKFDSQGVYGTAFHTVEKIWYTAGCRNSDKFRAMCAYEIRMHEKEGRSDRHVPSCNIIRKSFSYQQTVHALKGLKFINSRAYSNRAMYNLRAKDYIAIGRVSLPLRYALCQGRELQYGAGVAKPSLNYAFAAEVQGWTKAQKSALLSPKEAWYFLYNRCPFQGKNIPHPAPMAKWGKAAAAFAQLVKEFDPNGYKVLALRLPIFNLCALFGSYNEVKKFVGGRWTNNAVHDAGQFTLPKDFTPNLWAGFCMKHPEALKLSEMFGKIEQEFGVPKSIAQLKDWASQFTYEGAKGHEELAMLCNRLGVEQSTFEQYKALYTRVKGAESCPHVDIAVGNYRLYKLAADDVRGALLGLMTDCCQHLTGAGASCAVHGVQDPTSAFYVVEYKGEIIAQSWAWRSKTDALIFDSIEGLKGYDYNNVACMFQSAGEQIVGRLGINRVLVGNTSYGITSDVKCYFENNRGEVTYTSEEMRSKCSYMDGAKQWVLVGGDKPTESFKKKDLTEKVDVFTQDVNVLCPGSEVMCEHCDAEVHPDCEICPSCGENIAEWV